MSDSQCGKAESGAEGGSHEKGRGGEAGAGDRLRDDALSAHGPSSRSGGASEKAHVSGGAAAPASSESLIINPSKK